MRTILLILFMFVCGGNCFVDRYDSDNYICHNLNRQRIVSIEELDGMWYQIEKIVHNADRHRKTRLSTCPVVYISKDRATTPNPLYKGYGTTYGAGYPYNYQNSENASRDYQAQLEYDKKTTYDAIRRNNLRLSQGKLNVWTKHLKLSISDGISSREYQLRYNVSDRSFWIISGSDDGIQDNLKHFIGVIQVLKAVGNHLVLNVCDPHNSEKYTMILSREKYLESWEIHNVHSIIIGLGLKTDFVEQTCNHGLRTSINLKMALLVLGIYSLFL